MTSKKSPDDNRHSMLWIGLVIFVILAVAVGWVSLILHGRSRSAPAPAAVRLKVPSIPAPRPETNPEIIPDQQEQLSEPDPTETQSEQWVDIEQETAEQLQSGGIELKQSLQDQDKSTGADNAVPEPTVTTETAAPQSNIPAESEYAVTAREPKTTAFDPEEDGSQDMSTFEKVEVEDLEPQLVQSKKNDVSGYPSAEDKSTSEVAPSRPIFPQESKKKGNITTETQIQSQLAVQPEQPKAESVEPPKDGATIAKPVNKAPFSLQAGAFLTKTYADKKMAELIAKGYDAYIFETIDNQQRRWFTVRFGHFESREQAIMFLNLFKKKEKMTAVIKK